MDFCTAHFGKTIFKVTLQDIEEFFTNERLETDQLEFKSISQLATLAEKFAGIQRSVTAFANSGGGLVIWGAPAGVKVTGRKEKVYQGGLTFFDQVLEKDFVVSKISDSIIPLPSGVRVSILADNTRCVVIIEVDSSDYSPHQTGNVYYMRIDGQTKPAPHHYIEALFKKIKYPMLEAHLKISQAAIVNGNYWVEFELYIFNWSPLQNEEWISFRVLAENGVFRNSANPKMQHEYRSGGAELVKEKAKDVLFFGEPLMENHTVLFDPHKVNQDGNIMRLLVAFGGRFSPRKTCEYKLDFRKLNNAKPGDLMVEKNENLSAKDIQDKMGATKESIIKRVMCEKYKEIE